MKRNGEYVIRRLKKKNKKEKLNFDVKSSLTKKSNSYRNFKTS